MVAFAWPTHWTISPIHSSAWSVRCVPSAPKHGACCSAAISRPTRRGNRLRAPAAIRTRDLRLPRRALAALANADRRQQPVSSLLRQSAGNELGDAAGGGRVQIRQHGHNVPGCGADLEFAIHPGSAPAMTKTADAVGRAIIETERIAAAPRRINF